MPSGIKKASNQNAGKWVMKNQYCLGNISQYCPAVGFPKSGLLFSLHILQISIIESPFLREFHIA